MMGSEVGSLVGWAHGNNNNGTGTRASRRTQRCWKCMIILSQLSGDSESVVRVHIVTFSPTPHHPKVIVLPKVPFLLLEVIINRLQVCHHTISIESIVCLSWNLNACIVMLLTPNTFFLYVFDLFLLIRSYLRILSLISPS